MSHSRSAWLINPLGIAGNHCSTLSLITTKTTLTLFHSFFSRSYLHDGAPPPPYLGGCRLHGHSLDIPPESETETDDPKSSHFPPDLSSSVPGSPVCGACQPPPPDGSRPPSRGQTPPFDHTRCSPAMHRSCICVNFIAEHTRAKEDATKVRPGSEYLCFLFCNLYG